MNYLEISICDNIKILAHGEDRKFSIKMYFILKLGLCFPILLTGFKAQGTMFSANVNADSSLEALMIY